MYAKQKRSAKPIGLMARKRQKKQTKNKSCKWFTGSDPESHESCLTSDTGVQVCLLRCDCPARPPAVHLRLKYKQGMAVEQARRMVTANFHGDMEHLSS